MGLGKTGQCRQKPSDSRSPKPDICPGKGQSRRRVNRNLIPPMSVVASKSRQCRGIGGDTALTDIAMTKFKLHFAFDAGPSESCQSDAPAISYYGGLHATMLQENPCCRVGAVVRIDASYLRAVRAVSVWHRTVSIRKVGPACKCRRQARKLRSLFAHCSSANTSQSSVSLWVSRSPLGDRASASFPMVQMGTAT